MTVGQEQEEQNPLDVLKKHYPHIHIKVDLLWGSPELHEYLTRIIFDDRYDKDGGKPRQGFPKEVMAALLKLYNLHAEVISKHLKVTPHDIWHNAK
jgi:hypothetical protein